MLTLYLISLKGSLKDLIQLSEEINLRDMTQIKQALMQGRK